MIDELHLHLGHEVAVSISHQGIDPRFEALLVGPYITRLIRRICILEGTDRIRVVDGVAPMILKTVRSIGMLQRVLTTRGAEY